MLFCVKEVSVVHVFFIFFARAGGRGPDVPLRIQSEGVGRGSIKIYACGGKEGEERCLYMYMYMYVCLCLSGLGSPFLASVLCTCISM